MTDAPTSIEQQRPSRGKWPWVVGAVVVAALVALVIALIAANGSSDESAASGSDGAAAGEPVAGGTLEIAGIDAQTTPDPQAAWNYTDSIIANNVTDKLTWQDPATGEITPWLAKSWEHNDDLTEFTFHLRDDVTFSDGTPFDAAVVKANYDQYVQGDEAKGLIGQGAALFSGYVGTEVIDDHTVKVTFDKPSASFLQATSFSAGYQPAIVALSTLEKSAEERQDPTTIIGTGPFVYESWEPQVKTVLKKRDGYNWAPAALAHDGGAYLDRIVFNTVPEASVRTGALETGELDAIFDVQTTDETRLADTGFQVLSNRVGGTDWAFDFNLALAPTNELAVRKAIQLGWDRSAVGSAALSPAYEVSTSILAKAVPGYVDFSESVLRYDPEEAARLLDEAGWVPGADGIRVKDGKRLEVTALASQNIVVNKPAVELIQQNLKDIGIDLKASVLPPADFTAARENALTDWNIIATNRSRNDPAVLGLRYNPLGNVSSITPEDWEGRQTLLDGFAAVEKTLDRTERDAAAKAAQELVLDTFALTNPVYTPTQVLAFADYVNGHVFDAQSRSYFLTTWADKAQGS